MASKSGGFIKLFRSVQETSIWEANEKYDKRSAWIDLLLSANWSDRSAIFNGKVLTCGAGQIITSQVILANRWGWNVKSVRRFLRILVNDDMITMMTLSNRATMITIVNYQKYQGTEDEGNRRAKSTGSDRSTKAKR